MTITVRIDEGLERKLALVSKRRMCTRSDIVKESLLRYLESEGDGGAYELGKSFFGQVGSGKNVLSTKRKFLLKEKIREKNIG